MRVFNGKAAADQYMSAHTLTYSTPETILKKFAYWLGDLVDVNCELEAGKCPNEDGMHPKHRLPRLMLYIEIKDIPYTPKSEEVDDTSFRPTGAVSAFYGDMFAEKAPSDEAKFCPECGTKISKDTKFCPQCGTAQK